MANVLPFLSIESVNKGFQTRTTPTNNAGNSPFNVLLGNSINVSQTFKGLVIGDFVNGNELEGIYVGNNLKITPEGMFNKWITIDGGYERAIDLTRKNPIDIIDGVNNSVLPVDNLFNWGRPILDGGVLENITF